jgi:hypothetical protein
MDDKTIADGAENRTDVDTIIDLRAKLAEAKEELERAFRVVGAHKAQAVEATRIGCENITARELSEKRLKEKSYAYELRLIEGVGYLNRAENAESLNRRLREELLRLMDKLGLQYPCNCQGDFICCRITKMLATVPAPSSEAKEK